MPPKRKKRFHGLYYHSSPPRVIPMNGQAAIETKKKSADDFSIRLSTIRIWMHEKDIGKLTRVLWAGQGNRLRQQASTNPKVKRFLAAVPYVMNSIKDVHQSVVDNSLETLRATMESNVPPALITCKDSNGLNVIHKAAGLGHTMMLEYLLGIWPDGAHETDMTGKTPLHWAASAKNNMRCYTLLTQAGCEEDALDYKMKTPLYYKQKHNEIERSFLTQVPEAPRVSQDIPVDWEALAGDESDDKKKPEINIANGRRRSDIMGNSVNLLTSRSEANSIENTSEPDFFQGENVNEEEHHEPPAEEAKANDEPGHPLENGHVTNSEVDISESVPITPPKTPEEAPKESEVKDHEEDHQIEKLPEEENVGNALNDQKNIEANTVSEAENEESDNNIESGDEKDVENDHKDNGKDDHNEEEKNSDKNHKDDEKEGIQEEKEQKFDDHQNREDKTEKEEEENQDDEKKENENKTEEDEEKTDLTDSIKGNNETHNDDEKSEEQIRNENDEAVQENPSEEEEVDVSEKELNDDDENESSSPPTEKTQVDELQSETEKHTENKALHPETPFKENPSADDSSSPGTPLKEQQSAKSASIKDPQQHFPQTNTQLKISEPERPQSKKSQTGSSHSNDSQSHQNDNITNNKIVQNEESNGKHKETEDEDEDEDDDDQDLEIRPIDTPQPHQEPQIDENENNADFDDKITDSITSSMAIEGFVRGDSEDNQLESESAAYLDDEERYIDAIISSGDMEQLAALVLNGDGKKILNKKSSKPEIQAFLTNVPAYMDKISRVHEAARQGTLYQLQAALDRRKFAIAKDESAPCGASPLHVAVLFGNSDIVRYLAGRFPETTSAVDDDGRTALHYAATINDNGHFFNLLSHLGGNPKATDKLGNTAEFYMNDEQAKDILTYRQLLKRFGSEALEDEMLNDQGKAENYTQNAIFKTEQGKYLASSLGDPLIKGLTEIADKRPTDPVAYLAGFLQNFIKSRNNNNNNENNINNNNNNRDNDTGDTNSTALANSDAEIIATPNNINGMNSPAETEELLSSPESTPKKEDRDEHGQSMLHFACARSHRRNGLLNLIEESQIDITYRDELYRTARDVSLQANQPGNAKEIDRFVLSLAVVGDLKPFEHMAIAGYDHILDVVDEEGTSIAEVAESRGHDKLVEFFTDLRFLEESREELHQATRNNDFERVKEITSSRKGKWLIKAKNYYGRNAMHIAVLKEQEETVEYLVNTCPDALKIGDNLERTPLHYAMGTNSVESISRVLIRKGAKRTTKDLKGRQPSYYFINKADILRLQEEEDEHQ